MCLYCVNMINLALNQFMDMIPDKKILVEIVKQRMPFGKYKGTLICDLPDNYLEYFQRNGGFPKGRLGIQMETVYEIKLNGLEDIILNLKSGFSN